MFIQTVFPGTAVPFTTKILINQKGVRKTDVQSKNFSSIKGLYMNQTSVPQSLAHKRDFHHSNFCQ
jgi:hypothetical protein